MTFIARFRAQTIKQFGAAVTTVIVASSMAGCGASTIDDESITKQIVKAQSDAAPDLKVDGGSCPKDIEAKKGATFECSVNVAGVKALYKVTVTKIDGDDVIFDFEPSKAIISVPDAVSFIEGEAEKQGFRGATADCGESEVIVQDAGTTFPCTVSLDDGPQELVIEILDTAGSIQIKE